MKYSYDTSGTCSRRIDIEIENGVVKELKFAGGCNGNLQGLTALARGMKASELAEKLRGIQCGMKGTSCPDQLARALKEIEEKSHS